MASSLKSLTPDGWTLQYKLIDRDYIQKFGDLKPPYQVGLSRVKAKQKIREYFVKNDPNKLRQAMQSESKIQRDHKKFQNNQCGSFATRTSQVIKVKVPFKIKRDRHHDNPHACFNGTHGFQSQQQSILQASQRLSLGSEIAFERHSIQDDESNNDTIHSLSQVRRSMPSMPSNQDLYSFAPSPRNFYKAQLESPSTKSQFSASTHYRNSMEGLTVSQIKEKIMQDYHYLTERQSIVQRRPSILDQLLEDKLDERIQLTLRKKPLRPQNQRYQSRKTINLVPTTQTNETSSSSDSVSDTSVTSVSIQNRVFQPSPRPTDRYKTIDVNSMKPSEKFKNGIRSHLQKSMPGVYETPHPLGQKLDTEQMFQHIYDKIQPQRVPTPSLSKRFSHDMIFEQKQTNFKRVIKKAIEQMKILKLDVNDDFKAIFPKKPFQHPYSQDFLEAVKANNFKLVRELVHRFIHIVLEYDYVSQLFFICQSKQTCLHWCAKRNHHYLLQYLINKGSDINSQDQAGRTPLYIASKFNHGESVSILLANKANTFQGSQRKLNPIDVTTSEEIHNMINKGKMVRNHFLISQLQVIMKFVPKTKRAEVFEELGLNNFKVDELIEGEGISAHDLETLDIMK